jgi:acyl transferase domain-containing protein
MKTAALEHSFDIQHDNQIMRNHLVHGVSMLPGVVLLDLIYRVVGKRLRMRAFALHDVAFFAPIVTSDQFNQRVTLRVGLARAGSHAVTVHASSVEAGALGEPQQILECQLREEASAQDGPRFDAAAFIAAAARRWDMEDAYAMVREARITHGDFMKARGALYHREGRALAQLHLSPAAEAFREHFVAHPVFLDAATSLQFSTALGAATRAQEQDAYIPFSIRRFRIERPLPAQVFVLSEPRTDAGGTAAKPDLVSTDIKIFDAEGTLLVAFDRATGKRIRDARHVDRLLSAPDVRAAASPQPSASVAPARAADTLVGAIRGFVGRRIGELAGVTGRLANDEPFYDLGLDSAHLLQLTKQLEEKCDCRLYPTFLFEYKTIDEVAGYLIEHHAGAFAAELKASESATVPVVAPRADVGESLLMTPYWGHSPSAEPAQRPLASNVVLVCARDAARWRGMRAPVLGELRELPDQGDDAELLAHFGEALLRCIQGALTDKRALNVQLLLSDDERGRMLSGLASFLASAHAETPKLSGQVVLCDAAMSPAQVGEALRREACDGALVTVRYLKGERHTRSWRELALPSQPDARLWRADGAYLITGGAGGLGLRLARHIAERAPGCVLHLCSRAPNSDALAPVLAELRALAAEVQYARVDVADSAQVHALVQRIASGPRTLRGVFHAAGSTRDSYLARKTPAELAEVMAAKVRGTINLDLATRDLPLDMFVAFSSLAALLGNPGQADYAAANACMDALLAEREQRRMAGARSGRSLSVNWPLWREGGMRVDQLTRQSMWDVAGLLPLETREGWSILERALAGEAAQVAVAVGAAAPMRAFFAQHHALRQHDAPTSEPAPRSAVAASSSLDIAIIGISGAFPQADDLEEFWQNLAAGRDCISEVPPERWSIDEYYSEERGKAGYHHCKWGGFMRDVDKFDARFFHISPREAELTDPQERLFLEHAWRAMEDAGYRRKDLQRSAEGDLAGQVGVYAGVMFSEYQLFGAEASVHGTRVGFASGIASVANRVSYVLDLHGPSMTIDSMCSGALTSLYLACQDLRAGRTDLAFAGAANLTIHPNKYTMLSAAQFIAPDGRCASFGEGGDGYVPGEGVGVVVLKRLADAERDGDAIRGVIRALALNHGGRTNGYSVPNPKAQEMVITRALRDAAIDPRTVSYVEAHGTGTKLGDPIEVTALSRAFGARGLEPCLLGSAKSNVGHCEAAAGFVGLAKVLLQLEKGQIAPSLHSRTLNPHIDFAATPFVVNQELCDWRRPVVDGVAVLRRAGISSFGAGGSNAHLIVDEYERPSAARELPGPSAIVLSAKTQEQVRAYARKLLAHLSRDVERELRLTDIAFTLQVGREAMEARLGLLVDTRDELVAALRKVAEGNPPRSWHVVRTSDGEGSSSPQHEGSAELPEAARRLASLLRDWADGADVDWRALYVDRPARRISLPTYPFKRTRYWAPDKLLPKVQREPASRPFRTHGPTKSISLSES